MKTNRFAAVAALVAAGLLAGCGGGGSSHADLRSPALSASAKTPLGLTATFAEDKASVALGGGVTYTLTLTNNTSQPITYEYISGCLVQAQHMGGVVTVKDAAGNGLFPDGNGCTAGFGPTPATIAPDKSVSDTVIFTPSDGYEGDNPFTTAGLHYATASFQISAPGTNPLTSPQVGPLTVNVQ